MKPRNQTLAKRTAEATAVQAQAAAKKRRTAVEAADAIAKAASIVEAIEELLAILPCLLSLCLVL